MKHHFYTSGIEPAQLLHDAWNHRGFRLSWPSFFDIALNSYSTSVIVTGVVNLPDVLNCFNLTVALLFFFSLSRWFRSTRFNAIYNTGIYPDYGDFWNYKYETIDKNREIKLGTSFRDTISPYIELLVVNTSKDYSKNLKKKTVAL